MNARHLLLAVAAAWSLCTAASAKTVTVRMVDGPPYYEPQRVEIGVGDTVEWANSGPKMVHILTNENATFYSDDVPVGKNWTHTFTKAGVYDYVCFRHFFMRGTIVVKNPDGTTISGPEFPYQRSFREWLVPTRLAIPRMIIASRKDDTMWFTEGGGDFYGFEDIPPQNKLASIDDSGRIVEYATPTETGDGSKIGVDSLVMDRRGDIWFTERISNRIGRLDGNGRIREFDIPTKDGYALGVDLDSHGNAWFAERYGNRVGWITPEGKITEIELPDKDSEPRTIFVDSSDRVWYTAREANQIGWLHPKTHALTRLLIPTKLARPAGICEGRDATIWFVEMVGNKLAKVVDDQIVEYPVPTKFAAPFKCAVDTIGNVWFTEVFGNSIAKFDPKTEQITEFRIPTPDSRPGGIAIDRKGRVWFTEQKGNRVAMLDPSTPEVIAQKPGPAGGEPPVLPPKPKEGKPAAVSHKLDDFRLPTPGGGPGNDLVEDDTGNLWFPEVYSGKVAALNLATGNVREIELPTPISMPVGLARDRDGTIWVSEFRGNQVARIDGATGRVEEYALPTESSLPAGITIDEHGDAWVALLAANRIARFDRVAKRFEEHELPGADNGPLQIVADHHGSLWVSASEEAGNAIARFDLASKTFERFALPTPNSCPVGMLIDGNSIWVAEGGTGRLARLDLSTRSWEELPIPEKAEPVKLAKDRAGRLWLTDGGGLGTSGGNRVLVFDPPTKSFTSIPMATRGAKPMGIVAASDGNIWFTQQGANRVTRIRTAVGRSSDALF